MKKKTIFLIGVAIMSLVCFPDCRKAGKAPEQEAAPAAALSTSEPVSINLTELLEKGKMPPEEQVEIEFDHVFHTSKVYRAYRLRSLLEPYLRQLGIDSTSEASVTFFCSDGYQPTQKLSELLSREGFIAFHDESVTDPGQHWPDSVRVKFRPFYIVWKNMPYEDRKLNWPYGVYQLDIHPRDDIYDPILPVNHPAALAGFGHFQQYCLKCHSINRIGGSVGPEFNDPRNITEYWEVENIWAYAKNPQSFRFNAHMQPIAPLTRAEFDKIIVYLKYMRGR